MPLVKYVRISVIYQVWPLNMIAIAEHIKLVSVQLVHKTTVSLLLNENIAQTVHILGINSIQFNSI